MKKAGRILANVLQCILILVVLAALSVTAPKLLGIQPMVVLSGSMEPTYPVGSLLFIRQVDTQTLREGMVVTYEQGTDTYVTHRILSVDQQGEQVQTKGDANNVEDGALIPYGQIVGTPLVAIPYAGYVADYISTIQGKILAVTVVVAIALTMLLLELLCGVHREPKREKTEKRGRERVDKTKSTKQGRAIEIEGGEGL